MDDRQAEAILENTILEIAAAIDRLGEAGLPVTLTRIETAAKPARDAGLTDQFLAAWRRQVAEEDLDEEARATLALMLAAMRGELPDWAEGDPDLN